MKKSMKTMSALALASITACTAISLSALASQPQENTQQVASVQETQEATPTPIATTPEADNKETFTPIVTTQEALPEAEEDTAETTTEETYEQVTEEAPAEEVSEEQTTEEVAPQETTPVTEETKVEPQVATQTPVPVQDPVIATPTTLKFTDNGLLAESATPKAQQVINLLISIPGHSNGSSYHKTTGLDNLIDELTPEEAVYVIHRIEGAGFGQTGDGYAGYDTPVSHQTFVKNQVNKRFGGDIKALLKMWGTYSYGGY